MAQPETLPPRRRWRPRRRFFWFLGTGLLAVLLAVTAGFGWFYAAITVPKADDNGGPVGATPLPDRRIHIVIMGHDVEVIHGQRQPTRTDTIMVASFDPLLREVAILSIPRDTRVRIPGRSGYDKINAAHAYGGPELTVQTVSQFLGVPMDGYVDVGVEGFQKMVDILGGVDVDVPYNMNYDDPVQDLHIHIPKGRQHLDGYQAMGFVRERYHDPRGDFGRMDRQHEFIRAMVQKMLQPGSWPHVPQLMVTLAKYVRTDLDASTMMKLAEIGREAGADGLVMTTLPTKDLWKNGISYQEADAATLKKYVDRYVLGIDPQRNAQVAVRVLNGAGTPGLAASWADLLRGMGYDVIQVGNASAAARGGTVVYAKDPRSVEARVLVRTLSERLPGVQLRPATALDAADRQMPAPSEGSEAPPWAVTIVLGQDAAGAAGAWSSR
ncbi:MAG: LCP family protein [Firmicutes bacterium]|nr:LCP family protein [Bacillota bacterium]